LKSINSLSQTEQYKNLIMTSKPGILTSLLLALLLVSVETNTANSNIVMTWFIILILVSSIRVWLLTTYQRTAEHNEILTKKHLKYMRIGTLTSGALWGVIGALIFASNDFEHIVFLIFILAGLTAGNAVSNASDLPASIGFSILALLPLSVELFISDKNIFLNMGLAIILYFSLMVVIGRFINKNMIHSTIMQYKAEANEKEAWASKERYSLILQHSPAGILHYNKDLIITYCNDRFAQLLKTPKEKLIGLDMKTLNDKRILPALKAAIDGEEGSYEGEYRSTLSNTLLWLIMFYAPLRDTNGMIDGGIAIIEDITERKSAEEEGQKLFNNLRQAEKIAKIGNWHLDLNSNNLEWSDEIFNIFELDKEKFLPSYEAFILNFRT
jgi:PAS domain S-box-containing protein